MILDEELKPISPQEAKDKALFGPVYHGATSDKLEKINTQGFRFTIGHEREGNTTHGLPVQDYVGGMPPPIHFLGFGVYFTTSPTIAKEFGYGNTKIGPYFLDMPRMTTINWGSPNTMMKWWIENGYDYKRTPETTYGSGKTDLYAIRQERMRATLHLTETLKLKYDGIWYKGRGIRRLLDGDQVVIFNPDEVYKLDKTLVKPGEIGSKVVAKVGIDPYGRGEIKVPMGTKGIIIDKKKPHELQKWAEGSEWLYNIKWEKGGSMWDVPDKWIEPYQRAKIRESVIQRRNFWKDYEQLVKETEVGWSYKEYLPISKQEEDEIVGYIKRKWGSIYGQDIGKTLKKIKDKRKELLGPTMEFDMIDYGALVNGRNVTFHIRKTNKGTGFSTTDDLSGFKNDWKKIISPPAAEELHEALGMRYSPMTKKEEQETLHMVILKLRNSGFNIKDFRKVSEQNKVSTNYPGRNLRADIREYEFTKINKDESVAKLILMIRKRADGFSHRTFTPNSRLEYDKYPNGFAFTDVYTNKVINEELKENTIKNSDVISKFEEDFAVDYIKRLWGGEYFGINKTLKKKSHKPNEIIYSATVSIVDYDIYVRKNNGKFTVYAQQIANGEKTQPYEFVPENINERDDYEEGNWKEGDEDHYKALQQTGYWGRQGAGAIILAKDTGRILLPLRSRLVEQPNTWGVWGGAIDDQEDPASAVKRELSEEVGHNLQINELLPMYVFEDPRVGFRYSNFLAVVPNEFSPKLNWETQNAEWVEFGSWPSPIHFGLKALLQHSGNRILEQVRKYSKQNIRESISSSENKEKYKAAVHLIHRVWADMNKGGDYKNRFDYGNNFVHWMLNSEDIHNNLLTQYGKQFYPNSVEPHYDFAEYVEKILEMLEQKYYQRITRKVDKNDPLYYLKQSVKGNTWNKAKQNLKTLISGTYVLETMPDDVAEGIFNRLYKSAMGETFYDASKMKFTTRLDKLVIDPNVDSTTKVFIQHYTPKGSDRFPDKVKVWRGLHTPTAKIRPGDFVTFDNAYARGYVSGGKHGAVVSDILPIKDLLVFKPDIDHSELIYWPEGHQIQQYTGPIPTFKEFYLQYK